MAHLIQYLRIFIKKKKNVDNLFRNVTITDSLTFENKKKLIE